jgi:hypothetical protein
MQITMRQKELDLSEQNLAGIKMSSLTEMNVLVHEIADYTAESGNWKDRVSAASRAMKLGWERTKGFYYNTARRVDAEEMDIARAVATHLRERHERLEAAKHVEWLRRTIESLREDGGQLDGESLDVLERLAGVVGSEGRSMVAMAE